MAVYYETRLLEIDYLKTQLDSVKEIKNGTYGYKIKKSDNANSNSVYITITHEGVNGYRVEGAELRISDHHVKKWDGLELMIDPKRILTTKKKKSLMNCLKDVINRSKYRFSHYYTKRVEKINNNV